MHRTVIYRYNQLSLLINKLSLISANVYLHIYFFADVYSLQGDNDALENLKTIKRLV